MQRSKNSLAHRRQHGYVMLAVLVCLVIAGLSLVTLAQRSMRLSTLALERQRELQRKWGALSCQRTLLPAAAALFDKLQEEAEQFQKRATKPSVPAPASFAASVILGGTRFELLLADENAKVNLNHSYHHRGRAGTERLVSRSLAGMFRPPVRLFTDAKQVDPFETLMDDEALPLALGSWGQVFDLSRAAAPAAHRAIPQLTSRLTLWGQGKLNVRRAADATIVDACQLVISQGAAQRLQRECRDKPKHHVDRLVEQLSVDREEQLMLQEMLTEHSSCFSLWTTVSSMSTHVAAQRFAILQVDDEGVTRTIEFIF